MNFTDCLFMKTWTHSQREETYVQPWHPEKKQSRHITVSLTIEENWTIHSFDHENVRNKVADGINFLYMKTFAQTVKAWNYWLTCTIQPKSFSRMLFGFMIFDNVGECSHIYIAALVNSYLVNVFKLYLKIFIQCSWHHHQPEDTELSGYLHHQHCWYII